MDIWLNQALSGIVCGSRIIIIIIIIIKHLFVFKLKEAYLIIQVNEIITLLGRVRTAFIGYWILG